MCNTYGWSSSVMVRLVPVTVNPLTEVLPATLTLSPAPSLTASWTGSMLKVAMPDICPAAMLSVKSDTVA